MTSASEFEAALCQLEDDPPDIREHNANIREERWTHFSLEGVRFPAMTVDVIQRGEALAVFERDLIIHFQQISTAAALYVRALLGGVKRALEVYRRVDDTTKNYPWATVTTEERWHSHAEGALMVALTSLNLPAEAWKSARILRAIPNCRLVLMMSYHLLEPCVERGREWPHGISSESTGHRSICYAGDYRLAKLEVCRQKIGRDWRPSPYGYSATPGLCENSLEASSRQQEGEFCLSATIKHTSLDESQSY